MPEPLKISNQEARRFLLAHHRLWPPRRLKGKQGILEYIRHVNCIQYDPINVVGGNPHLVLQSRVRGYSPRILDELLYEDRSLLDGFDKVMSIYPVEDWPFFSRHRTELPERYYQNELAADAVKLIDGIRLELASKGPLSSLDFEENGRMQWWWGSNARAARVALDILFLGGEVVVHHRVGTRRYFDLAQRVLLDGLHASADPHLSFEAYQDWHVERRVGGLGLAHPAAGEHWGGMLGMKSGERREAIRRLAESGRVLRVEVEGLEKEEFYLRGSDLHLLQKLGAGRQPKAEAALIAPLDNLMWHRNMLEMLFDFYYRWEVYMPASKRQWGYYVLPVLYGDRFVARLDPKLDRKTKALTIENWWWEDGVEEQNEAMLAAIQVCLREFKNYSGAEEIALGDAVKGKGLRNALAA